MAVIPEAKVTLTSPPFCGNCRLKENDRPTPTSLIIELFTNTVTLQCELSIL